MHVSGDSTVLTSFSFRYHEYAQALFHKHFQCADGNMKMIWKSLRNWKRKIATAVIALHHNAQDEQQVRLWDLRSPETSHWQTVLGSTS